MSITQIMSVTTSHTGNPRNYHHTSNIRHKWEHTRLTLEATNITQITADKVTPDILHQTQQRDPIRYNWYETQEAADNSHTHTDTSNTTTTSTIIRPLAGCMVNILMTRETRGEHVTLLLTSYPPLFVAGEPRAQPLSRNDCTYEIPGELPLVLWLSHKHMNPSLLIHHSFNHISQLVNR